MFTVRDFCKDLDSFAESLKKVADIGYKTVQISGTCDYEPEWLKSELDKYGLKCVLTHNPTDKVLNETIALAKKHDVFDCKYIGIGWFPFNDLEKMPSDFINEYKSAAGILKANNKYFMYHNHDFEFSKRNGKTVMQYLLEDMPADLMGFTFDTYWAQNAGADPAFWLEQLKGRVPCIHIKDHTYDGKFAVIGEGNMNFDRIFEKAEASGTEYLLVEQDECYDENPFNCLKRSYEYLKSCGF